MCVSQKAPRWNVRSSPVRVKKMLASLTPDQRRIFVEDTGFSSLLHFNIETPIPPAFLQWLMIHITHETMYIRVGSGKKIKITKEVFHHILGLSNQGVPQERGMQRSEKSAEAKRLRKQLGVKKAKDLNVKFCMDKIREGGTDDLTKRCFFLVLFNRLLFPMASWQMSNSEIERTKDMTNYANIDWRHEIYTDVYNQMRKFHENLEEDQVSYTLPGCSVAIAVRMMYSLSLVNLLQLPCIQVCSVNAYNFVFTQPSMHKVCIQLSTAYAVLGCRCRLCQLCSLFAVSIHIILFLLCIQLCFCSPSVFKYAYNCFLTMHTSLFRYIT